MLQIEYGSDLLSKYKKARKKLEKKLKETNVPVTISELFMEHVQSNERELSFGEFYQQNIPIKYKNQNVVFRLTEHIKVLTEIANKAHEKKYFQPYKEAPEKKEMKSECKNCVTRLNTAEFSLYTKSQPLTQKKFSTLLANIVDIASKAHENLHLCLSSVPVLLEGRQDVVNTVIYVECGSEPKVHYFSKRTPSFQDIGYAGTSNYAQAVEQDSLVIQAISEKGKNIPISHKSVIRSQLAGGGEFLTTFEICIEHTYGMGNKSLTEHIEQAASFSAFVPQNISQLVTSNTVSLDLDFLCGEQITHVTPYTNFDPAFVLNGVHTRYKQQLKKVAQCKISLNEDDINSLQEKFSDDISFLLEDGVVKVNNSPFGGDYIVFAYGENKITAHNEELSGYIATINDKIIDRIAINAATHNAEEKKWLKKQLKLEKNKDANNLGKAINKAVKNLSIPGIRAFHEIMQNLNILEDKGKDLKQRDFPLVYEKTKETGEELKKTLTNFLGMEAKEMKKSKKQLIVKCNKITHNAFPVLSRHRNKNTLLALAANVINGVVTNNRSSLFCHTSSSKTLENLSKSIDKLHVTVISYS